jgi:hypothetical protein
MPVASENPTTENYYLTQAALGALVASQVSQTLPMLDPGTLAETFEGAREVAASVAFDRGEAAVGFAMDYYEEFRRGAGVRSPLSLPIREVSPLEVLEREIDVAAAELLASLDTVVDEIYLAELTLSVQAEIEGEAQRMVADAARDQIFESIRSDPEAKGWARITRTGACSFCRMLASRGAVYSKEGVKFRAHTVRNGRGGVCQCVAEPVIGKSYEATAQARADAALWERISEEGFRGSDARNEFRRHIEDRADGVRRLAPRSRRTTPMKPAEVQGQRLGFDHFTPAQLAHQMTVLEKLPDTDYKRKQVARVTARLKALGSTPA